MKILVTGVTGRIGATLAKALIRAGHQVRGFVWPNDRGLHRLKDLPFECVEGNLTRAEDVRRAVAGVDGIHHLGAAFQAGGPFTDDDYFEINVRGTFNMLQAARAYADQLDHFFFASSDALYHKYVPGGVTTPIREDEMPLAPAGPYALSKQLGEDLCRGYCRTYGLPTVIFRFALTVAGNEILHFRQFYLSHWRRAYEKRSDEAAIRFLQQLPAGSADNDRLVIVRDKQGRSYKKHIADARDIAHGLVSAIGKAGIAGETFQLAGPKPFTWEETIPYLAEKLNMDYIDVRLPNAIPTFYEFDLTKSKRHLGFRPEYDIFRMIDAAIAVEDNAL